jgi:hypothetical protein
MAEYWIVYKDIEDSEPRQSFEVMAAPKLGEATIPSEILPMGEKEIYVRWYHRQVGAASLHLLTYTHVALKAHQVRGLVSQALGFLLGGPDE